MTSYYVVQTNPVEGREREYNDWYNDQHLPDVLAVDGFAAARRYALADVEKNAAAPYRYLALYKIEGEPAIALENLAAAVSGGMFISDAMDRSPERGPAAFVYTAVGDRVVSES